MMPTKKIFLEDQSCFLDFQMLLQGALQGLKVVALHSKNVRLVKATVVTIISANLLFVGPKVHVIKRFATK